MDSLKSAFDHISLARLLSDFAGSPVVVAGGHFTKYPSPYIEERQFVAQAVESRRAEFFSGRYYARQALRKLGIRDAPILRAEKGNPLWPAGVLGSISHDAGQVVAVAMVSDFVRGLGVDLVLDPSRIGSSFKSLITRPDELSTIANRFVDAHAVALVFSLKEAVVKAVSPGIDYYLDFMDIELSLRGNGICARLAKLELNLRCGFMPLPNGLLTFAVDVGICANRLLLEKQ